jgi:pimeloyl-ACP methyl ester carboxylesterase
MIVFVHGVPETAALWDKVRAELGGESVALALPGFGNPRPEVFAATKDDYVDWLVGQLEQFPEPVDLVGHDWGAGLTYRVATAHGSLLRSWVADVANVAHPDYVWHDFAQMLQAPGGADDYVSGRTSGAPADMAAVFEAMGVGHDDAVAMAEANDQTMNACIADLYRSAVPNAYADWGSAFGPTAAPGLVLCPDQDPFGDERLSLEVAEMLGARHQVLAGLGHWWALQDPKTAAAALAEFHRAIR